MSESADAYPVRRVFTVTAQFGELKFQESRWFRTAKVQRRGDVLENLVDSDGKKHLIVAGTEWREVCQGVAARRDSAEYRYGGGRAMLEETTSLRVERGACPVSILVLQVDETESEHYTHRERERYAVLVQCSEVDT
jgi:hypothetical protein